MENTCESQFCSLCHEQKPLDAFYVRSNGRRRKDCAACHSLRMKQVYLRRRDELIKKAGEYKKKHAQKTLEANRRWRAENRARDSEVKAAWRKRNPHMVVAAVQRRKASKLQATPKWACEAAIQKIYETARNRTLETGVRWHVDHIVPLRSNLVCGLHCEANLQLLTATDNKAKANVWWPDMP